MHYKWTTYGTTASGYVIYINTELCLCVESAFLPVLELFKEVSDSSILQTWREHSSNSEKIQDHDTYELFQAKVYSDIAVAS